MEVTETSGGTRCLDMGISAAGGLEAGRLLAEVCLAGLAQVEIVPGDDQLWPGPAIIVRTDHPVAACMASQYAGWRITDENFFAMGSGPMRAAAGRESLFDDIGYRENPDVAVGVLEAGSLPPAGVCQQIADACRVPIDALTLLVARTASQAGGVQVVARSVETALHKLHELHFDLRQVISGFGVAPLPPVARDDLTALGRTNDAVLYGATVNLWVRSEDARLEDLINRIPSCASNDFGAPFGELFARCGRDFYRMDPHLFSPARVVLHNLQSGHTFAAGQPCPDVIRQSFGGL